MKIKIDAERCKGCGLCAEFCPKKVLALGGETNKKGYRYAVAVDEKSCVGCGSCAVMCPDCVIEIGGGK